MKKLLIITTAIAGALLAATAQADTRTTRAAMTLPAYVESVGCKIVDMGGYSNVQAADGGFCEGMKGWNVEAGQTFIDPDGVPGTGDEGFVRDNT